MSEQSTQENQTQTQGELGTALDTPAANPQPQPRQRSRPSVRAIAPQLPAVSVAQDAPSVPPMPRWAQPANNEDELWDRFEQQCDWAIQHNVTRACISVEVPKTNGERGWAAYRNFDVEGFDPMDLLPGTYRIRFRGSRQQWGTTIEFTRAAAPGEHTQANQPAAMPTSRVHGGLANANGGTLGGQLAGLGDTDAPMSMNAFMLYMMKQADQRAAEAAQRSHEFMLKMIELGKPTQPGGSIADQLALIKTIADMTPKSDPTSIIGIAKDLASEMIGDGPAQPDKPRVPRRDPWERAISAFAPIVEKTVDAIVSSNNKKNDVKHVPNVAASVQTQAQSLAGVVGHDAPAISGVGEKPADAGAGSTGGATPSASPVAPSEAPTDEQVAQSLVYMFLDIMQAKAPWTDSRDLRVAGALAAAFDAQVPDDQTVKRIDDIGKWIEANIGTLGGECTNRGIPPTRAIAALNAAKHLILGRDDDDADDNSQGAEGDDE